MPRVFNFKKIIAPNVFTYRFIISRRYPVVKIRFPSDRVDNAALAEDVEAPSPGLLCYVALYGSIWFHPGVIVTTPPDSSPLNVRTTLQTYKGNITFALSLSINASSFLVVLDDGWLSHVVQT